jgi:hypothetical protein
MVVDASRAARQSVVDTDRDGLQVRPWKPFRAFDRGVGK